MGRREELTDEEWTSLRRKYRTRSNKFVIDDLQFEFDDKGRCTVVRDNFRDWLKKQKEVITDGRKTVPSVGCDKDIQQSGPRGASKGERIANFYKARGRKKHNERSS